MLSCCVCLFFRLSVCPSVTFVDHVKTNKHIFEIFPPPGSHTILVFPHQTGWRYSDGNPPNRGVECKKSMKKSRFSTYVGLYWTFVFWCLQHIYRVTLIGVFLGNFVSICTKLARSILMRNPNTGTQPNFQKLLSKSGILSPKNSCSHISSPR